MLLFTQKWKKKKKEKKRKEKKKYHLNMMSSVLTSNCE